MSQAEARAKAMMANNTWVVAHAERNYRGVIMVRYKQFMTRAGLTDPTRGDWKETNDDTVT